MGAAFIKLWEKKIRVNFSKKFLKLFFFKIKRLFHFISSQSMKPELPEKKNLEILPAN